MNQIRELDPEESDVSNALIPVSTTISLYLTTVWTYRRIAGLTR